MSTKSPPDAPCEPVRERHFGAISARANASSARSKSSHDEDRALVCERSRVVQKACDPPTRNGPPASLTHAACADRTCSWNGSALERRLIGHACPRVKLGLTASDDKMWPKLPVEADLLAEPSTEAHGAAREVSVSRHERRPHRGRRRGTSISVPASHRIGDVLVLCGDLTDYGLTRSASPGQGLTSGLRSRHSCPRKSRLRSGEELEIVKSSPTPAFRVLDGDTYEIHGVGFAGVRGFCGGFGRGPSVPGANPSSSIVQGAAGGAQARVGPRAAQTPHRIALILTHRCATQSRGNRWRFTHSALEPIRGAADALFRIRGLSRTRPSRQP